MKLQCVLGFYLYYNFSQFHSFVINQCISIISRAKFHWCDIVRCINFTSISKTIRHVWFSVDEVVGILHWHGTSVYIISDARYDYNVVGGIRYRIVLIYCELWIWVCIWYRRVLRVVLCCFQFWIQWLTRMAIECNFVAWYILVN